MAERDAWEFWLYKGVRKDPDSLPDFFGGLKVAAMGRRGGKVFPPRHTP